MKKIFRKNQIIITALALIIAVAGYINYTDSVKKKNKETQKNEAEVLSETDAVSGDILSNDAEPDDDSLVDPGAAVFTDSLNSQFIISAKLEREQVRASNKESLLEIINNEGISDEQKTNAINAMVKMTETAQKEMAAELMLEAKGFANVIVTITDESVETVIETDSLSDTQRAQIEDIVTRKTGCGISALTISTITPVEKNAQETGVKAEQESETETQEDTSDATETTPDSTTSLETVAN